MDLSISTYNKHAEAFANKWDKSGPRITDIEKAFELSGKSDSRVLELGFGSGRDASEILKRTTRYTGIDATPRFVEIAKKNSPQGQFILSTFDDFKPSVDSYDIVFAFASLIHCDKKSLSELMTKIHESLGLNGIFYISLKFGNYQKVIITDETGNRENYLYTPEDIQELSKDLFKIIETDRQNLHGQDWFTIILQRI